MDRDNVTLDGGFSPEEFVEGLYRAVLNRGPDEGGRAHWVATIRATGNPGLVLQGLMASSEYTALRSAMGPRRAKGRWDWTGGEASIRFGAIAGLARSHPDAGLPDDVDVIVPVYRCAGWLEVVCDALAAFGLRPLYIVDANSTDDTLAILRRRGERLFTARNDGACVEALLCPIIPHLGSPWVLRLDDDELPTRGTLAWISECLVRIEEPIVGLPRRYVRARPGGISACEAADGSWNGDVQYRLFRPEEVTPIPALHTPGYQVPRAHIAPETAGFLHLDWLVRDETERLRKVEHYESLVPGAGWFHESLYLPERMGSGHYRDSTIADEIVHAACRALIDRRRTLPEAASA